jgi:hypothetical protein
MKLKINKHCFAIFLSLITLSIQSQSFISPLKIPPALSANFGELRNNHFHSGLDFKTQQTVNKPVFAAEDGYISRIGVSPGGFGLSLYIDHPSGFTTVYGHLNRFSPEIAEYVIEQQYLKESYQVTLFPDKGRFAVKKGEQIALSGNSGGSGGPHLHFEIRETKTQDPLDPLLFIGKILQDTRKPEIRGIAFYPVKGKGVVNNTSDPSHIYISHTKTGEALPLSKQIEAWGLIGIGVKAYDRMNGQNNIYGVKQIRLFVDSMLIYSSKIDRFSFEKTRMINSFVDFEEWRLRNSFFMKSYIEPGNNLPVYNRVINHGYIDIDQERDYMMRYELEDYYGNVLTYPFVVKGKNQNIKPILPCKNYMAWNLDNSFVDYDFTLRIPARNLYSDFCFVHTSTPSTTYYSAIHHVHPSPVPLDDQARLWIKLNADILDRRENLGIVEIKKTGKSSWIGGDYKNGGVEVSVKELGGKFAIDIDTVAPKIVPLQPEKWVSSGKIRLQLSDDKSGITSFRGEIDGKYALFTHDIKSPVYTYHFDENRLDRNKEHILVFRAEDGAKNISEYRYTFSY